MTVLHVWQGMVSMFSKTHMWTGKLVQGHMLLWSWITYLSWCLQISSLCQHIQSMNCVWGSLMIECCQGSFITWTDIKKHLGENDSKSLSHSHSETVGEIHSETWYSLQGVLWPSVMNKMLSVCGSWVLMLWSVGGSPWPCWSSGAILVSGSSEAMFFLAKPWQGCLRACEPMPALHCK